MYPILFEYGSLVVSSYGVSLALGFSLALYFVKTHAPKHHISPDFMENLSFGLMISGLLGARFLYTFIERPEEYLANPVAFFYFWQGGLSFYGSLLGAIPYGVYQCRKNKVSFLNMADLVSPALSLALGIGKIGCFLMGCCQGSVCHLPLAVTFSHPETLAYPTGTPLHPSQLYEMLLAFALFLGLKHLLQRKQFEGQVFYVFLMVFLSVRSLLEQFRGDPGHLGGLTTAQFLSIPMLAITAIVYAKAHVKLKK